MTARVPVSGGDICSAFREDRADGPVFVKELTGAPEGFFEAEARGLDWLRVEGGPPLPEVLDVTSSSLTLSWVPPSAPSVGAARTFGASLARLHEASPASFGGGGYAATIPLDDEPFDDWPSFFAQARLLPLVRLAVDAGHRETDLALLHLFGAPLLTEIVAAYAEVTPLAVGWEERMGLHQLHPLLLHAVLFGGGYGAAAAREARRYL